MCFASSTAIENSLDILHRNFPFRMPIRRSILDPWNARACRVSVLLRAEKPQKWTSTPRKLNELELNELEMRLLKFDDDDARTRRAFAVSEKKTQQPSCPSFFQKQETADATSPPSPSRPSPPPPPRSCLRSPPRSEGSSSRSPSSGPPSSRALPSALTLCPTSTSRPTCPRPGTSSSR